MAKGNMKVEERGEWDNFAAVKTLSPSANPDFDREGRGKKARKGEMSKRPWYSGEACRGHVRGGNSVFVRSIRMIIVRWITRQRWGRRVVQGLGCRVGRCWRGLRG
jgi:hypothetical protein